ncbi:tudor domain-containing protein 5 [Pantherophis guttatus]|uniref:Tudor domain-containing protein 5 n=1 Tax=Pantherophis guttatus TaxID=94885 RepID=A0ABM3ZCM6_PANGU|nr:tudor domain-containing protein 5 [Pantherophis guttatus]
MTDQEQRMNSLKKEVRSLLTPIKEGLTPYQLEQEYKIMIGKMLPLRMLGYHSVMELVKDMPDTVNISPKGDGTVILKAIADESTKRIASLVARQKSRSKPQHSKHNLNFSLPSTFCSQVPLHHQHSLNLPRHGGGPPILPPVIKSELKEMLRFSPVLLSDFDKAFAQHFGRKFEFVRYGFFSMFEVLNAASDIIQIVQTRAGSLLTLKEHPLTKQPEMSECKMAVQSCETEQTLPVAVPEPVAEMPSPVLPMDVLCSTTDQKSDDLQTHMKLVESPKVRTELKKEIKIALAQRGPGGIVSSELKEKIKIIVAQHPNGLHASKLPGEFEEYFHEKMAVRKLGFLNLMELIGALNDVLRIECREGEKDWLIFDIDSQSLPDDEQTNGKISQSGLLAQQEASEEHEVPSWDSPFEDSKKLEIKFNVVTKMVMPHLGIKKDNIIQEIMEEEIPPDAVQDETLYCLPKLDKNAFVGLFVEDIVSPSQFHVRIYGGETSDELENIMIEMRRCYSSNYVANRYVIPETFIRPGQLCCVKNSKDKWWYRVIIHRLLNDQEVEVFYPDFGNITVAQKSSLRLLKHCYAKLPAQVIPGCLAWVKPSKGDWSVSAIKEFRRLCELKLLVGLVDEYINDVLYLFLCDTSSDDDVYLHNVLKLEGHALICRENIPSKGFEELNPFTLYMKPNQNQHADFTEADTSLLQQDFLVNFPGTNPETCNNEVVSQHTASQFSDPELPYLEPVYLCQEIWDENWLPSPYEKKKNEDASDNLHTDIMVVSHQTSGHEGNKNKIQHNQSVIQKTRDVSSAIETADDPSLEHPSEILSSMAETKTESSVGDIPDSLSQTLEEFYVSIVHSEKPRKLSQNESDVNKSSACHSQLPPSTSVLHGRPASENMVNDASRTQTVSVYNANRYFEPWALGHNALVFTAELQGSPKFCIPCSPTVALGASARLAVSGGYFPLTFRKMKISQNFEDHGLPAKHWKGGELLYNCAGVVAAKTAFLLLQIFILLNCILRRGKQKAQQNKVTTSIGALIEFVSVNPRNSTLCLNISFW